MPLCSSLEVKQISSKVLVFLLFAFWIVRLTVILVLAFFVYDVVVGQHIQNILLDLLSGRHLIPRLLSILLVHFTVFICVGLVSLVVSELLFLPVIAKVLGSWSLKQLVVVDKPRVAEVYGGLLVNIVVVSRDILNLDPQVRDFILTHELAHVKNRHLLLITLFPLTVVAFGVGSLYVVRELNRLKMAIYPNEPSLIPLFVSFIALPIIFIVIMRACEVWADYAAYRALGPKAYEAFKRAIKVLYPDTKDKRGDFISRFLHTGRRDLVLKYGDPLAPHNPLEFLIPGALITSGTLSSIIMYSVGLKNTSLVLSLFLFSLVSVSLVMYLLSLVVKPVIKRITRDVLTEKGSYNLGLLLISLYLSILSIGFALVLDIATIAVSIVVFIIASLACFITAYIYIRDLVKSILTTLTIIGIIVAISTLQLILPIAKI